MSSDEEQQMKKIYDDIMLSTDSTNKKKGVKALASYGKKAIPLIQELRNIETNNDMKSAKYFYKTSSCYYTCWSKWK
ncbi:MAG: hypothetical protein ACJ72Q_01090 [Nitrososphaeraceae archaeon]